MLPSKLLTICNRIVDPAVYQLLVQQAMGRRPFLSTQISISIHMKLVSSPAPPIGNIP